MTLTFADQMDALNAVRDQREFRNKFQPMLRESVGTLELHLSRVTYLSSDLVAQLKEDLSSLSLALIDSTLEIAGAVKSRLRSLSEVLENRPKLQTMIRNLAILLETAESREVIKFAELRFTGTAAKRTLGTGSKVQTGRGVPLVN